MVLARWRRNAHGQIWKAQRWCSIYLSNFAHLGSAHKAWCFIEHIVLYSPKCGCCNVVITFGWIKMRQILFILLQIPKYEKLSSKYLPSWLRTIIRHYILGSMFYGLQITVMCSNVFNFTGLTFTYFKSFLPLLGSRRNLSCQRNIKGL